MRIGVDARELGGHATGAGRYLGGLLAEWTAAGTASAHEFVLYAAEPLDLKRCRTHPMVDARRFATRLIDGPPGTWWEQVKLPRVAADDHLDVFFAPAYTAPLRLGVPTVVAIHDVSFVAHPEWFRFREGIRRRTMTAAAARHARTVVTISAFSQRELVEHLGVPATRIQVIPPGVDVDPDQATASRAEYKVLFVGSIFNRRHVPDLVRAFARVARGNPDASLDIVGDNRSYPRENVRAAIAIEGLEGRVRWHQYVPEEKLRELYARARAFAFLSEYEGLGLTPLEALAAGVPPVLLDTPVAHESCGDAALYVPPDNLAATARAIEQALTDEPTRARILGAAPAVLARYTWPRAARDTLTALETAAKSG